MRSRVRPMLTRGTLALLASMLIVPSFPRPAFAQWSSSSGTNLQLSSFTSLSGVPGVCPDFAGGAVYAWADARGAVVQRVDALGNKKWGASGIVISGTAQVAAMTRSFSDDAGGVIVGWAETAVSRTGYYVQRVDRTGTALWGAGGVLVAATGNVPAICSDAAGGVIVLWTQTVGGLVNVYANRVGSAGTLLWGASGKLVYSSGDLKNVDLLVPSSGNGAILGWHDVLSVNLVDPDTLFFQRIDGSGNPQWPSAASPSYLRVITLDDTQIELSCAGSSGAAYFTTQRADSLYLHLLQPAGTFSSPVVGWPVAGPTTARVKLGLAKFMIPDGAGGVVLAWRDESYGGSIFGRIRTQRLNASGVRQWPTAGGTFVEVCPGSNDQNFPSLLRDGFGNYVVGWMDYRNNLNYNLWAQKLEPVAGGPLWPSAGVVFASATDNQFDPRFAAGNPGNVIAAFDDARTGQEKLYTQFLGPDGALVPASTVTFTTVAPLPVPHGAAGYTAAGGLLFVEGGGAVSGSPVGNSLAAYAPATDAWTTPGTGYVARWFGNLAYVPETGKLYALNGHDNVSTYHTTVEEIATGGGAATLRATNPQPREGAGVVVANGKIVVIGGNNDYVAGGLLTDVRTFDPVANAWSAPLAPLPQARLGLTAVLYNGSIFAVGGQLASGYSKRVDRYDIATNTWTTLPDAPLPIAWQASAVTGGLLWFAGDISTGWNLMSYAPATGTWTVHTTNLLARRFASLGAVGNTLVVTGGAIGSPSQNNLDTQVADVSALVAATPLAAVTLPVPAVRPQDSGDLVFASPGDSTLVTMNFATANAGTATVQRWPGPAANVTFSSGTPTQVGATRWVMSESGVSPFTATLKIQLYGLPDTLGAGSSIAIYQRATPGSGPFAPLPTTYDPVTNRVQASVTALGEFILGSGGTTDVPVGGVSVALALRALGPDPARAAPEFRLELPTAAPARLELFDLNGRVMASRAVALPAGVHTLRIAGSRPFAAGLYFARLTQGGRSATARVVVAP